MNSSGTQSYNLNRLVLRDQSDTIEFSRVLAQELNGGMIVGFSGALGTGKTTLIRALVAELGGLTPVSSPTYVLQHEYHTASGLIVDHWDLFRLPELPEELQGRCPGGHLWLIEWPERAPDLLPFLDIHLTLDYPEAPISPNQRCVTIEKLKRSEV